MQARYRKHIMLCSYLHITMSKLKYGIWKHMPRNRKWLRYEMILLVLRVSLHQWLYFLMFPYPCYTITNFTAAYKKFAFSRKTHRNIWKKIWNQLSKILQSGKCLVYCNICTRNCNWTLRAYTVIRKIRQIMQRISSVQPSDDENAQKHAKQK